jgi:hypothetical protein
MIEFLREDRSGEHLVGGNGPSAVRALRPLLCGILVLGLAGQAYGAQMFFGVGGGGAMGVFGSGRGLEAHVEFGVLGRISPSASLGGRARAYAVPYPAWGGRAGASLVAHGRLETSRRTLGTWMGASAGLGLWSACFAGDFCGAIGPITSGEVGLKLAVGPSTWAELALELGLQFGAFNGVDVLLLPSVTAGLRF